MATWADIDKIVAALPETSSRVSADGHREWRARDKPLAWERPLRRGDIEALGEAAPAGPILGIRTIDVGAKEALLADDPEVYFTTPHFNGYPAILVRLERAAVDELTELIVEVWLTRVPKKLAKAYLEANP